MQPARYVCRKLIKNYKILLFGSNMLIFLDIKRDSNNTARLVQRARCRRAHVVAMHICTQFIKVGAMRSARFTLIQIWSLWRGLRAQIKVVYLARSIVCGVFDQCGWPKSVKWRRWRKLSRCSTKIEHCREGNIKKVGCLNWAWNCTLINSAVTHQLNERANPPKRN